MATASPEVTKVSKEAIEKAEIALGLRKAEEPTATDADKTKTEELKKAEEAKVALEKEYADTIAKAEEIKAKIGGTSEEEKKVEIAKAALITKDSAFEKSVEEKFNHLAILIQAKKEENEEIKKSVGDLSAKLEKSEEFNAILGRKLGIIEKQPLDRKAVTTTTFIEKGGEAAGEKTKTVMSLATNKKEISDLLFAKAVGQVDGVEKVVNGTFAKAAQYVELGCLIDDQNLTKSVQSFLAKEHNIVLTK